MKITFLITLFCLLVYSEINSQSSSSEENIISYYAVSNSLDGQPMIDMQNILRFYPIYAMRDSVTSVNVTIYYGKNIFTRDADKMDNGKYWRVLLPNFNLGEAIQKIEVEVKFEFYLLLNHLVNQINKTKEMKENELMLKIKKYHDEKKWIINTTIKDLSETIKNLEEHCKIESDEENNSLNRYLNRITRSKEIYYNQLELLFLKLDEISSKYLNIGLNYEEIYKLGRYERFDETRKEYFYNRDSLQKFEYEKKMIDGINLDSLDSILNESKNIENKIIPLEEKFEKSMNELYREYEKKQLSYQNLTDKCNENIFKVKKDLEKESRKIFQLDEQIKLEKDRYDQYLKFNEDNLRAKIIAIVFEELVDKSHTGPSVQKSDVVVNKDLSGARLLYRNYKENLRKMLAADPAERLGIFRIRYVPFPIVGLPDGSKTKLIPFSGDGSKQVFEIGLSFGDAIVPGDDFVVPEFSIKRLGIALAISEKLFSSDAQIKAIALTYDFNSYGSIGIGGNFAQDVIRGYASFGINQKAFQQLLKAIAGIFN